MLAALAPAHAGTCTPEWSSISGTAGADNTVTDIVRASNGDIIACGYFTQIEGVAANGVARWNGTSWQPLGSGLDPNALQPLGQTVLELPNGHIVMGGEYTAVGGGVVGTQSLAEWDGSNWSSIGGGITGRVDKLVRLPSGDLIAAGLFTAAGGTPANNIARWNGSSWSALGSGTNGWVQALKVLSNGDLIVGGSFTLAGDVAGTSRIARWNALNGWSPIGTSGLASGTVYSVDELSTGDIVIAGNFNSVDGVSALRIAHWNGAAWSPFGAGFNLAARCIQVLPNDELLVGGQFTNSGGASNPTSRLARWNGSAWSQFGGGVSSTCLALTSDGNGGFLAGGNFTTAGGVPLTYLAHYGCPPAPACAADFNTVNGVTVQDIFDFLTAWLAGSTAADFNTVNGVTVQDIFDFLTAWLAGC